MPLPAVQLPAWLPLQHVPDLSAKQWTLALAGGVASLAVANYIRGRFFRSSTLPPLVPALPFIGCAVQFGERPIDFLMECTQKYGPVFSFNMFGANITYLMGSEASTKFWSSDNDDLNAEDLYANITRPVFGPGVAFDVSNKVFSEQKMVAKTGLTLNRFEKYTAIIEKETHDFLQRWGESGRTDFYKDMAEMVIFTATHTLHGIETRNQFTEEVAHLYHDLDGGFSPLAWFFPSWVPFPSFIKRDNAHRELKKRFAAVIQGRRASGKVSGHDDLLETFMTSHYEKVNDGRPFNTDETSGLLIALLMAGQHTSSTVSAWLGFFIAQNEELQEKLYQEQITILGKDRKTPVTLDELNRMSLLWACVREALRLRPPIMTMMRKCRTPFTVTVGDKSYVIPKGDQVCVSPTVNGRLESEWDDPMTFDPYHFLKVEADGSLTVTQGEGNKGGKFKWVPFGAGRHRCIGFEFGQIQIRTIFSYILRNYKIKLADGKFPTINYQTMIHTPNDPYITYERRH